MTKPLVVARIKTNDPSETPKFTKAMPIESLLLELVKTIPVDKVYVMVEDEDGEGFRLREMGSVYLDIVTKDEVFITKAKLPEIKIIEPVTNVKPEKKPKKTKKEPQPTGMVIDNIIPATPETEEASSMFGKI